MESGHAAFAPLQQESRGFKLTKAGPLQAHGQDLVSEIWELKP